MELMQNNVLKIKRLGRNGSIGKEQLIKISAIISGGGSCILPIDCVYGFVSKLENSLFNIETAENQESEPPEIVISNFKMLENMAIVDKTQYDFLKRIWPGEVVVQLKNKLCNDSFNLSMRMPKHRFIIDIINEVGAPLLYAPVHSSEKLFSRDGKLHSSLQRKYSLLFIEDLYKNHSLPTKIDISCQKLEIIRKGRVSSEEIKSLYLLGDI